MSKFPLLLTLSCAVGMAACKKDPEPLPAPARVEPEAPRPLGAPLSEVVPRGTPYVPPQCYTKTQDADGSVHNPCFTCHVTTAPPNYIGDASLQLAYEFGPVSRFNPWTNIFVDRTAQVAAQGDEETLAYVRQDNYSGLNARLQAHAEWDVDADGHWSGWTPDIGFDFDQQGFDKRADGSWSGWRAYAYFPVPGTFWPTNGSFGDALIRLPEAFQKNVQGAPDRAVYIVNLAILEALLARRDVPIEPVEENTWGVDLDGDGKLGQASRIKYAWTPKATTMSWVGGAKTQLQKGELSLLPGLFPAGTELAHSVRYLDVEGGKVRMARRMKELRYMKKVAWRSYGQLEMQAIDEAAEKSTSPNKRRVMLGSAEKGISNNAGWRLSGFIEDEGGELRPQSLEEHAFCIGCHSGVGATDDSVFSFARKLLDGEKTAWQHQAAFGLEGMAEPVRADGRGEYALYLEQNGAGDELRANDEVLALFFTASGKLRPEMKARLRTDVSVLLVPTAERALRLDKAYRVIVREQSFIRGRDATITPAVNVHRELSEDEPPTGVRVAVTARSSTERPPR